MQDGDSKNLIYSFLLETKKNGPLRFGAFLCFAGWLFFFIATVYLILPSERAAISDEALAVYAAMMLLLGLCLLTGFLFFNSQVAFTNPPDQWRSKIPGLDIAALGTAIPSGLLSFYILIGLVNAYPEDTLPDSQFAVTIPLPAEKIPSQETDAGARHAVMFWTVDPLESSPHEGLAKMVVACILVMGFGLIYPRLGSEADNDKGLMQGLVIPFIGTILFGAGAVEHADAEELRNDVKLLKHDLPPVRNILDGKREIYITNINELSPIGLRQMQSSLKSLSTKFAKTDFSEKSDIRLVKGDVETLRGELRVVQKTIDAIPNLRIVTAVDPKNDVLAALKKSIDSIHSQTKQVSQETARLTNDFATLNVSQKNWFCALMRERVVMAENDTKRWRVSAENLDRDAERNLLENIVVGIVGESKRENSRRREIDYPMSGDARFKEIMSYCGLETTEVRKVITAK